MDDGKRGSADEARYRILVEAITDYAIYMLDTAGRITSWNPGAERLKGYTEQEIVGQHFSTFYTEEDRADDLPARALEIAAQEGRFEREGWRRRKDGTQFWANVIIDPIRDANGQLIGFAKITRDISEKRAAQEAIFQAQKMEAVGQLTGGLAHDFNNLLMAILGSLEIARKRAVNTDVASHIDNAILGAQRGASLTQRLLAFSRRQELQLRSVDVSGLVSGMTEMMRRTIGPEIVISVDTPEDLPRIRTDANQLESALLNLVVNARDAMPSGGEIIISAQHETVGAGRDKDLAPGDYVCLSVRDHGEGMDAETLAKATTPFYTTKGVGKGTGLGLPMVHGLMAQSGGKLTLRSVRGDGTTAELWLPATDEVQVDLPDQIASPVDEAPIEPMTVLVVDDDGLVLMNTVLLLEDLGHQTLEASSAEEALAILDAGPLPDVVVTDHAMPQMTGAVLAREIRARCPGMPIVLATGYAELPEGAEASPDVVRLSKPFGQQQLSRALAEARRSKS